MRPYQTRLNRQKDRNRQTRQTDETIPDQIRQTDRKTETDRQIYRHRQTDRQTDR